MPSAEACTSGDEAKNDTVSQLTDTADQLKDLPVIPEVWGPAPIQDRVETADLVEIGRTATVSDKAWFDDASFEGWTYDGQ